VFAEEPCCVWQPKEHKSRETSVTTSGQPPSVHDEVSTGDPG
jgi:hypothetical protein